MATPRRLVLCLVFCLGEMPAQNPAFRTETNVVQVPVSVADKKGNNVEGHSARDFRLLDNGIPRDVTLDVFDTGVAPISLAIAIQSAGISTPALKKIRRIGSMIQPLITGARGEAAVVTFDSEITWVQNFTSDAGAIQRAVADLQPVQAMQARMLDAIAAVVDRMKDRKGRKVLLLISETRDRGSSTKFEKTIEAVEREGIEVFAAHYSAYRTAFTSKPEDLQQYHDRPAPRIEGPDGPPTANGGAILSELARFGKTNAVEALTKATGGSDFPFATEKGAENSIEKLGVEIRSQYILNFPLPADATGLHAIEVTLPGHPGDRIRARRSYWAAR